MAMKYLMAIKLNKYKRKKMAAASNRNERAAKARSARRARGTPLQATEETSNK